MLKVALLNQNEEVIKEISGKDNLWLGYKGEYEDDYIIRLSSDENLNYLAIKFDVTKEETFIYIPKKSWDYIIKLYPQRSAFPSTMFRAWRNCISVRYMTCEEINSYRNLALNTHDQTFDSGAYPHASANVETRNESTFFALNAIDGMLANDDHGAYPFQSWGINKDPNACLTLNFGRKVKIDKLGFVLRGDYPHDSYWTQGTVTFSDGSKEILKFEKLLTEQQFSIEEREIEWLKFDELIKAEDDSPFPALTQIMVYGVEIEK